MFLGGSVVEENKESLKEPKERTVHPDCINASNPFHECSEYCFKRIADAKDRIERNDSGFPFPLSFMNEFSRRLQVSLVYTRWRTV